MHAKQQCVKLSESDGQATKEKRSNNISRQVNKTKGSEESSSNDSVKMHIIRQPEDGCIQIPDKITSITLDEQNQFSHE